jgi:hypothetical protein
MHYAMLHILFCLSLVPAPTPTDVDVNRDGRIDHVQFSVEDNRSSYTLSINDATYTGEGWAIGNSFSLCDIDSSDSYLEIAVSESGPSDDYATYFHYYDGKAIHSMGVIPGSHAVQVDGSGRVRTQRRGRILQTWFYPCVFSIDGSRMLRPVHQELYPMGTACTMKRSLGLLASRSDSSIVVVVRPGDRVVIEASDDTTWSVVRAPNGVWGWFKVTGYSSVMPSGIAAGDLFDGLSYAD